MAIDVIVQVLIGGVLNGGLYALVAFGLSLIYGVARILNFAHGTLLVVAGVVASVVFAAWGLNPLLIALVLAVALFVLSYVFYNALLGPLARRNHFESTVGTVLITVGALMILTDLTADLAGATQRNIPLRLDAIELGDIVVSSTQLLTLLGIGLMTLVMHLILKHTWFGRSVRSVTQDPVGGQICGVRSHRVRAMTFAFGSSTVAVAAVLYVLSFPVDPYMGFGLTVKAFTIIVVGGVGNLPGALLVGVLLGIAEGLTSLYWKSEWAAGISVVLMLLVLVARPSGAGARTA